MPAVLWVLMAAGGLFLSLPPQFDPNLLKLQSDGLESVCAVRKLNTWYGVVPTGDLGVLRQARRAFTPQPDKPEWANTTIERTESILDAMEKQEWLVAHNGAQVKVNWHDPPPPAVADLLAIADDAERLVTAWERQPDAGDLGPVRAAAQELARCCGTGRRISRPSSNAWRHGSGRSWNRCG